MKIEIELAQTDGYGKAHKAGCRDLRDPEPIGDHADKTAIAQTLASDLGWGLR